MISDSRHLPVHHVLKDISLLRNIPIKAIFLCGLAAVQMHTHAANYSFEAIKSFANQNVDKFAHEIKKAGPIGVGSIVTIRGKYEYTAGYFEYDVEKEALTVSYAYVLPYNVLENRCENIGSYVGQTALGVKKNIQERTCELIGFRASLPVKEIGTPVCRLYSYNQEEKCSLEEYKLIVKATPDQFRATKRNGLPYEIDYEIGLGKKKELVEKNTDYHNPTITTPFADRTTKWTINGEIVGFRVYLPGSSMPAYEHQFGSYDFRRRSPQRTINTMPNTGGANPSSAVSRADKLSPAYISQIIDHVRPNIVFWDNIKNNTTAEVEIRISEDGSIVGRRLLRSSGNEEWDQAVLRAVDRTGTFPRDVDGRVPASLILVFRPRE